MNVSVFQGWLEKGLGRAPVYLQDHDSSPFRDVILYACTHDLRCDRQIEDCRGDYMVDIIRFSGEMAFCRAKILAALQAPDEDESVGQMFQITRLLAEQGDVEARRILYDTFRSNAVKGDYTGAYDLIDLDGLDALLLIARHLAGDADSKDTVENFLYLIWNLEERDGEQAARQPLAQAAEQHPEIVPLLEAVRAYNEDLERKREAMRNKRRPDYSALKQLILQQDRKAKPIHLTGWGRRAREEELAQAADLLAEQDPELLLAYLHIFRDRRFPLDFQRLLTLAQATDEDIVRAALSALAHIRHPKVRNLALKHVHNPNLSRHAVEVVAQNYQEGDYRLLESLLEQPLDPDAYHYLEIGAREFIKIGLLKRSDLSSCSMKTVPAPFAGSFASSP
ncbi:MAG TPA: hypothetical protein VKT32_13465 [Chthonomonadaceae bacterium]|nr:hypothetical protein [Chthonomonadaceae bacterium]